MNKYRMYVDEVGNPDLGNADNPNHRFLSLTGIVISLATVKDQLHPSFEELKTRYFSHHPDDPIIFHRREMVNAKPPFEKLREPAIRTVFDDALLQLISSLDYTVITVVIDKYEHSLQYTSWRYDPYHYCMEILLERYVLFLERTKLLGDVMAESRGGKEDMRLKKSFKRICAEGTNYINADRIKKVLTSCQLKIKPKMNNIAGLQLADILAHPSRREILIENKKIDEKRKNLFADQIVKVLQRKYDRVEEKIYGKKMLP